MINGWIWIEQIQALFPLHWHGLLLKWDSHEGLLEDTLKYQEQQNYLYFTSYIYQAYNVREKFQKYRKSSLFSNHIEDQIMLGKMHGARFHFKSQVPKSKCRKRCNQRVRAPSGGNMLLALILERS